MPRDRDHDLVAGREGVDGSCRVTAAIRGTCRLATSRIGAIKVFRLASAAVGFATEVIRTRGRVPSACAIVAGAGGLYTCLEGIRIIAGTLN